MDDADQIRWWIRLQRGELPILWHGAGGFYNPDFIAIETDETRWVIEVKSDTDLTSDVVQEKRQAALWWANHVTDSPKVQNPWKYLLASESDISSAKGSWSALRKLGDSGT